MTHAGQLYMINDITFFTECTKEAFPDYVLKQLGLVAFIKEQLLIIHNSMSECTGLSYTCQTDKVCPPLFPEPTGNNKAAPLTLIMAKAVTF